MNFLVPPLPLRNRVDYDGRAELTFSACRPDAAHLNFFAHMCMYVRLHDCVKTHARIITYITSPTTYAHAISPLQKFSTHTHIHIWAFSLAYAQTTVTRIYLSTVAFLFSIIFPFWHQTFAQCHALSAVRSWCAYPSGTHAQFASRHTYANATLPLLLPHCRRVPGSPFRRRHQRMHNCFRSRQSCYLAECSEALSFSNFIACARNVSSLPVASCSWMPAHIYIVYMSTYVSILMPALR